YIEHRLRVAGALNEIFDSGAKREVFRISEGVPRLINVICDRALLGAYSRESRRVSRIFIRRAAAEISGTRYVPPVLRWAAPVISIAGVALLAVGSWSLWSQRTTTGSVIESVQVPATVVEPATATDSTSDVVASDEPLEPAEPDTSLDEQLMLASDVTDVESALATLFRLWNLQYDSSVNGCDQARRSGLECLFERGSWNSLRQLDRPAILTLTDSRGDTHRAVLTAIRGDRAELSIAGVDVTHPIDAISDLWFGQFLLIWRPANGSSASLLPGMRSPQVLWLRQSLAEIDSRYRTGAPDSDVYDAELERQVRSFQRDHRLMVDGLAGRQTQIIINSLLAPADVPRLATPLLARD
ncbi:MAG: peptidoglycan-binding protein, partial [Gammaproteobacteria bacterium]|nr:peptidoglycan-binding protein [Gammaproteobacteria bacterium]